MPSVNVFTAMIFLIPGAVGSGNHVWIDHLNWALLMMGGDRYFGVYLDTLRGDGFNADVCPGDDDQDTRTIEERAEGCVRQILERHGPAGCPEGAPRDVVLFGHSMGGLVARRLAQDPRVRNCIQSVTTISTPHRGTPLADFAIDHVEKNDAGWDTLGELVEAFDFTPERRRYLPELRSDRTGYDAPVFEAQDLPDNPAVAYYSISSSTDHPTLQPFRVSQAFLNEEIRRRGLDQQEFGVQNDGIVPRYSMVHGTFVGHLDVDHASAACVDVVKNTDSCAQAKALVIPHLEALSSQVDSGATR